LDLVGSSSPPSDISPAQNPPPVMSSVIPSDDVLNPNVDHDLPIVKQYLEYKNVREQRVYTNDEEKVVLLFFVREGFGLCPPSLFVGLYFYLYI
jgi:hypothetical protein